MVGVAQLVEPQVVALVVVGSSPIAHPIKSFHDFINPLRGKNKIVFKNIRQCARSSAG